MKRVGLIGFGLIGRYIYENLQKENVEVPFIFDTLIKKDSFPGINLISSIAEIAKYDVDAVVEAAHAQALIDHGESILERCDLIPFSLTAFSDDEFKNRLVETAKAHNHNIYIPHGAILGIDGLYDGKKIIDDVKITTTKHPKNLGLNTEDYPQRTILYKGSTREICKQFPRNVNVHATLAVAGIGFDRTQSILIADPQTNQMTHEIEIGGQGISWRLFITSFAQGDVTGAYTPESAFKTVLRFCKEQKLITII